MKDTGSDDAQPLITIAGHSHVVSFGLPIGARHEQVRPVPMPTRPNLQILCGAWPRGPNYWDQAVLAAQRGVVALSWGGNQHNVHFLIAPDPCIDFVSSGRPDLPIDPNAMLVPELAVRELFRPSFDGLRYVLEQARRLKVSSRIVVLGTPPPKRDNERLREYMPLEAYFPKVAKSLGLRLEDIALSLPTLRLKSWELLQRMACELAEEYSCHFCPSPSVAADEEGYLLPAFWRADSTHANLLYGHAMADLLQTHATSFS